LRPEDAVPGFISFVPTKQQALLGVHNMYTGHTGAQIFRGSRNSKPLTFLQHRTAGNSKVRVGIDAVSKILSLLQMMNAQSEVRDNPYVAVVAKKHRNLKKK
jgi:hypothetical protein